MKLKLFLLVGFVLALLVLIPGVSKALSQTSTEQKPQNVQDVQETARGFYPSVDYAGFEYLSRHSDPTWDESM